MTNLFDLVFTHIQLSRCSGLCPHPVPVPVARSFKLASGWFLGVFRIFSNPENDTDETLTTRVSLSRRDSLGVYKKLNNIAVIKIDLG